MAVQGALARIYRMLQGRAGKTPEDMDRTLATQFASNQAIYNLLWEHFDGRHWTKKVKHHSNGKPIYQWPLQINYCQAASFIHSSVWAGDMPDTSEPVAIPHLEPHKGTKKAQRAALDACEVINRVWYENHSRALLMGANTVAQAMGGVALKLRLDPGGKGWRRY